MTQLKTKRTDRLGLRALCFLAVLALAGAAPSHAESNREFVQALGELKIPGLHTSALGLTRRDTPLVSLLAEDDLDLKTPKTRILLIGGLDGKRESVQAVIGALLSFHTDESAKAWRDRYVLSVVPCANPDGVADGTGEANSSGGTPARGYPPKGSAYDDPKNPESVYLWRWIGMHAPDLVVDVRAGHSLRWHASPSFAAGFEPKIADVPNDCLAEQLPRVAACETGTISAVQVETPGKFLPELFAALQKNEFTGPSAARRELQRRLDRTPLEVAKQLSEHYGHDLQQVVYIPAVALIARVRLGELTENRQHLEDVLRITAPYFRGDKPTAPNSGSALSGHLIFCELADRAPESQRKRFIELARSTADLAFDKQGRPEPLMPFHHEMSDAVFMGGPILARVGRLTGDGRYYDACVRHIQGMRKLVLRDDGLYRHSPLDEAAWGRGNGFPALGLAMCLSDLPDDYAQRADLLAAFQDHMQRLVEHQDAIGMWHQVIDRPESYRELSCTCMIAFAMARGVKRGWLEREKFDPVIERAWQAIRTRVPANGRLVDVCTGTGKQPTLRHYYDRPAILGPDDRGGAMALLVCTELARREN